MPEPYLGMSAEGILEWLEILQKIYSALRGWGVIFSPTIQAVDIAETAIIDLTSARESWSPVSTSSVEVRTSC